jgi:hypothetical protein
VGDDGAYRFPLLLPAFCKRLLADVDCAAAALGGAKSVNLDLARLGWVREPQCLRWHVD